jgi:prepilin-type N-terminal cleavage/methylation domain-containing protein
MAARAKSQAGVTLIELMVTIAILGVAFGSILTGLSGMYRSDDQDRKLSITETWVRRYAEDIQAAAYVPCAPASTYKSGLATPPAGYTVTVAVTYWNGNAPTPTFSSSCPSGTDKGVQRVVLTVNGTSTAGSVKQSVVVMKRDPS